MKDYSLVSKLRLAAFGIILAILTLLFGQGMGIVFGLNEDIIKGRLAAATVEVREPIYRNDDVAIQAVLDKSWNYMQRAHLHAGGMGTTAVALIILICLLPGPGHAIFPISLGLGAGGLGYSIFWMWAGFRAPELGSTGAAKESLRWLAMPSSGAFVVATLSVFVLVTFKLIKSPTLTISE